MAKPGWDVKVTRETAKQKDGTSLQVPREVSWTGGAIPGDFYDEFVMLVTIPDAPLGTLVYFPVVQECGAIVVRWIEMPLAGEDPDTREWAMHMVLAARALERIGDNAVDIGEQTAFVVTGLFREFSDASSGGLGD